MKNQNPAMRMSQEDPHEVISLLERHVAAMQAELEQCRKDAERYRWLREAHYQERVDISIEKFGFMDAAIDKAMESGE